jgi:hypothetical protein
MKFKITVISLLMAFSHTAFCNELRVSDYKTLDNNELKILMVEQMGVGIAWANASFNTQKIYCAPSSLALEDKNFKRILDDELKREEYADDAYVGLVLLNGLQKTFPCK